MRLIGILLTTLLALPAYAGSAGEADAGSSRIVSADGAVTEILFALGVEDQLVGVDTTSKYPAAANQLPKVGYLRALPFEGVLSLNPDQLITTEEAEPEQTLQRLEQVGVKVTRLPVAQSPEQTLQRITAIGELVNREAEAAKLVSDLQRVFDGIDKKVAVREWAPSVLILLAAGNHGVSFGGSHTGADALLDSIGATNAVSDIRGYKPASREAIISANPDAIIVAETAPGQFRITDWPELAQLPAWKNGHRYVGDSMLLLSFGPRLAEAMLAIDQILPEGPRPENTFASNHGD